MTLPPQLIGDKGQRFVIETTGYPLANVSGWQTVCYCARKASAEEMFGFFAKVPGVTHVRCRDRWKND